MPHMLSTIGVAAVATIAGIATVSAWPQFLNMVPNANNVDFNIIDVGHKYGTIVRHQFGRDFGVGRNWTKELCELDSDKDGQTNGQELGDPCCVWSIGHDDLLAFTTGMSNPGNATSLADASKWKSLDCAAVQKRAEEKKKANATTPAASEPAGKNSATRMAVAGVSAMATITTALTLW